MLFSPRRFITILMFLMQKATYRCISSGGMFNMSFPLWNSPAFPARSAEMKDAKCFQREWMQCERRLICRPKNNLPSVLCVEIEDLFQSRSQNGLQRDEWSACVHLIESLCCQLLSCCWITSKLHNCVLQRVSLIMTNRVVLSAHWMNIKCW